MTDWEKVEEIIPGEGDLVLATGFLYDDPSQDRWYETVRYWDGMWVLEADKEIAHTPTHWAPITKV